MHPSSKPHNQQPTPKQVVKTSSRQTPQATRQPAKHPSPTKQVPAKQPSPSKQALPRQPSSHEAVCEATVSNQAAWLGNQFRNNKSNSLRPSLCRLEGRQSHRNFSHLKLSNQKWLHRLPSNHLLLGQLDQSKHSKPRQGPVKKWLFSQRGNPLLNKLLTSQ